MAKHTLVASLVACVAVAAIIPATLATAQQAKAPAPAAAKAPAAATKAAAPVAAATPPADSWVPGKPIVRAGYRVPRLSDGRPDIQGAWTNSTMTPEQRPAQYGARLIHTPAEIAEIEGANNAVIELGNKPTPVTASVADVTATPDCSGGRRVGTCNYNAGFTEPGDSLMRVNGQVRTSLLVTPNGRPPAPKAGAVAATATDFGGEVAPEGGGRGGGRGGAAAGGAAPAAGAGRGGAAAGGRGGAAADAFGPGTTAGNGRGGVQPGPQQYANPETAGGALRCITSFGRSAGPPMFDQLYNSHYTFVLGKDTLAIWVEMVHDVRIVRIGANVKHRTDGIRPFAGDSIGHWEGDTLVVETTNIPQTMAYAGSWENLTITEKFTRVSPTRLNYQWVVHDPTRFDRDWGGEYEFARSDPPYEYACHEGNYGLENILAGARAQDALAAGRPIPNLAPVIK